MATHAMDFCGKKKVPKLPTFKDASTKYGRILKIFYFPLWPVAKFG
jgi:hypothetical protein